MGNKNVEKRVVEKNKIGLVETINNNLSESSKIPQERQVPQNPLEVLKTLRTQGMRNSIEMEVVRQRLKECKLRLMSEQEIYDILDESSRQVQEGKHRPAKEALEELGRKYGILRRNYETNDKNRR